MYKHITVPEWGQAITFSNGQYNVPDKPIIPFIEGDGIGPDIWRASQRVFDASVAKAYGGKKQIAWCEIYAGEKAQDLYKEWLPAESLDAIRKYYIAIKGPLTTPVGGGFRSLNVAIRQILNLYACIRPVKYYKGVPSPVREPEKMDVIIFRENTEDVYSGIEYRQGTPEAKKLIEFLTKELGATIREDSGIGIKPISVTGSKQLVRKAIDYLISQNRRNITLMHKGNIMKFTEGSFKDWGYELAKEEYADKL
ncbi:MAG: NADP-dependent isocitrate dehydrogenase, partial [Calditrichaeota bacterium]|nr:NADP-dependent isocitrate dehydrogenase [Calditrichota bacterium]